MKTLLVAAFLIALSSAMATPPGREEVSRAIAQMETNLVSDASHDAAKVVLSFAEQSNDVQIKITPKTVPWIEEKWGLEPDMEQTVRSMLLAAYLAGNTKSQLAAGKAGDDPYAGWIFVCRGYAEFRSKVSFSSPSIDALERKRADGALPQYAREVIKDGKPAGGANGSQPIRSRTNSTSSAAGSRRSP